MEGEGFSSESEKDDDEIDVVTKEDDGNAAEQIGSCESRNVVGEKNVLCGDDNVSAYVSKQRHSMETRILMTKMSFVKMIWLVITLTKELKVPLVEIIKTGDGVDEGSGHVGRTHIELNVVSRGPTIWRK